ncbi:MAG: o-succinylbenzoate synthase [Verrucomicrobia bacterium]|nr:o-succinylbenzoate synthase [Verrucomicrobiota bacterium]
MEYSFAFRRYRLPFRTPLRTAHGPWTEREGIVVRLTDAAGTESFGEASPIPWFGTETVDEIEAVCRELGAQVDAARLSSVPSKFACLKNALAAAQSAADAWPPRQKHLGVAALIPAGRAALAAIPPKGEAGFRVFKWKVGVDDIADELGLLDDVCAALPEGGKLRLDANGAWDRRQAERWLERCADRPVEFVEQPSFVQAAEGESRVRKGEDLLLGLAESYPTPIALDESLVGAADIERWLGVGWPGIWVVKPALLADAAHAIETLGRAKADVVFSSALETGAGAAAALRIAFAWPGKARALGFGVWPLFVDSRFDGPYAAPFIRAEDLDRLKPEAVWNALS